MSKTAEKALNFLGGMAGNISAGACFAASPQVGLLCLGVAGLCVVADSIFSGVDGRSESDAHNKVTSALRELWEKHGTLEKAIDVLAADADMHDFVSRERAAKLLRAIRNNGRESTALISETLQLTAQLGIYVEKWCETNQLSIQQLSSQVDDAASRLSVRLDRIESRAERSHVESMAGHDKTHGLLERLLASQSNEDIDGEIDAAKQRLIDGRFDESIALLDRLRQRSWARMSDRQKYRVTANLGHSYEGKDNLAKAADFYMEAVGYQPQEPHAQCIECIARSHRGDDVGAALLAEELRKRHPTNAIAQALWLRYQPDDADFDELVSAIPESLHNDAEVAVHLSLRAFGQDRLEDAESYARSAVTESPASPRVRLHLGIILVECERKRAKWIDGEIPRVVNPAKVTEAISILTEVEDTFGYSAGAKTIARIRRARGLGYTLLNDVERAEQDIQVAFDRDRTDPGSSLDYALVQADHGAGGIDRAIQALSPVVNAKDPHWPELQLVKLLATRNKSDDRPRAIELARQCLASADGWGEHIRIEAVGLLVEIQCRMKDYSGAAATLGNLTEGFLSRPCMLAIEADIAEASGQHSRAVGLARDAGNALSSESTEAERRIVARRLLSLKLYAEALPLWTQLVQPTHAGRDALRLLEAAENCGDDATIIDFCRGLRRNGQYDAACIDLEVVTLAAYDGYSECVKLLQEWLARQPNEVEAKLARLRLSGIGIEIGRQDLVETNPTALPSVESANAHTGEAVTQVLQHGQDPYLAVQYAYGFVRRHFGKMEAHRALIRAFMFGTTSKPVIPTSDEVRPGFAVRYKVVGTDTINGLVIEDDAEPRPDFDRKEISPDDPRALELNGKKVGDTFFLRRNSFQDIQATVVEIIHKSIFRMQDCLEGFEQRFKDGFVIGFNLAKTADGTMDLSPIFRSVDRRQELIAEVSALFQKHRLPVAWLADTLNTPTLRAMEHVTAEHGLSAWTNLGTEEEQDAAFEHLRSAKTLVLSPSAIATLKVTGAFKRLHELPFKLVVSHGTLSEYRDLYREMMAQSDDGGIMTKVQDRHVFIPHAKEHIEQRRQELRELVDWLTKCCEVEDGTPLAYVPKVKREQLIQCIGRPCAESIALARTDERILWDDDFGVGPLAHEVGVKRVWTQGLLCWLADSNHLPHDEYHRMTIALLACGFKFTKIGGATIKYAFEQSQWKLDDAAVTTVLRAIADHFATPDSITRVVGQALRFIWTSGQEMRRILDATQSLLMALDRRRHGRNIVRRLYLQATYSGDESLVFLLHLGRHLKNWLMTGSVNDLSWLLFGPNRRWLADEY